MPWPSVTNEFEVYGFLRYSLCLSAQVLGKQPKYTTHSASEHVDHRLSSHGLRVNCDWFVFQEPLEWLLRSCYCYP